MKSDAERTDESLLARARAGDAHAFQALFEREVPVLRARVERDLPPHLTRRLSVSDLLQDTRLVTLQRQAEFQDRGPRSFRNWVLTILDFKIREALRRHAGTAKRAAAREVSRGLRPDTANFASREPSPSQAAIGAETATLLRQALLALPPREREVLRLVREVQLPLRDVAARIGRSYEATKKLYGRALVRFRRAFEHLERGSDG